MDDGSGFYTVDELRERLSISTAAFLRHRPIGESALGDLTRCGIRRIELLESPEQFDMTDMRSMRFIDEVCRSCGVEIVAFHAHRTTFSDLDTEAKRRERVDRCRLQIDTMLELGGVVWGSHAEAADATLVKCYQDLMRHVEGTGAFISVENFIQAGQWVEDRMAFLDEIDHAQVGLILDIGHVTDRDGVNRMCVPGGPTEVIEMCRRRLCHVHLHGYKDGEDHFHPSLKATASRGSNYFGCSGRSGTGGP